MRQWQVALALAAALAACGRVGPPLRSQPRPAQAQPAAEQGEPAAEQPEPGARDEQDSEESQP